MSAYSLPLRPPLLPVRLQPLVERSPTDVLSTSRGFGIVLEPRYIFGADPLDQ